MPQKLQIINKEKKSNEIKTKIFLIFVLIICSFFLTGCVVIKSKRTEGGVFKSFDKGETWEQKNFVSKVKKKIVTIGNANIANINLSPQDSNLIYLGTKENGLYSCFDGGEKWISALSIKGKIESAAFDPQSSAIAYASTGSKIFKTTNQGDDWEQIYLDANKQTIICLTVDQADSSNVYAGLKDGRLLRSVDYGKTWLVLNDFKNEIKQILINKNNTNIIYVATNSKGFYRTSDKGASWQDLTEDSEFSGIKKFIIAVFDSTQEDALIIATKYGLLKTNDGGKSWYDIKLLTLPGKADILALTINPSNANEIYYSTKEALFKTVDGGKTWKTISSPSSRTPVYLAIDYANPDILYMGMAKIK